LGEPAARAIAKDLLDYPQAKASDADQLLPAYLQVTSDTVVEAHDHFSLADVFHARPYYDATSVERGRFLTAQEQVDRQRWLAALRPFVTRQEAKLLTRGVGGMVRWAVKSDYQLHQRVCALLRGMAQSTGLDEFTPVAFVFTSSTEGNHSSCVHDSNITQRGMELGDATLGGSVRLEPDMVYSLFSTVSGRETPFPPHLERDCLTTLALLFTGVSMGLERYASITARPKKLQCRVPPESDSELAGFGLAERGLAWCVKWATDAVIAAVHPGWEPSGKLLEFAQKRRVEILRIGLDALPEATVRRLQQMHYTSTSLKRHPDSETIVQRFTAPDGLERSENGGQESK